jgi:hypothetical protein
MAIAMPIIQNLLISRNLHTILYCCFKHVNIYIRQLFKLDAIAGYAGLAEVFAVGLGQVGLGQVGFIPPIQVSHLNCNGQNVASLFVLAMHTNKPSKNHLVTLAGR